MIKQAKKKHPRHIYPNTFEPAICPLLALSIYLCYFSHILTGNGCLFPGNDQYCRFSRLLARVIETHRDEVIRMGHDPAFIGVHSIRKGAATYASSGSTCCPSGAAVNLRVGWTLGNVQDKYIWYEAAGD